DLPHSLANRVARDHRQLSPDLRWHSARPAGPQAHLPPLILTAASQRSSGLSRLRRRAIQQRAIGCFQVIGRDVAPEVEEVVNRFGPEPVTAHAWRLSASQARFLSSSVERTWSESSKSPRCADAYPFSIFARISLPCSASQFSCSWSNDTACSTNSSTLRYEPRSTSCLISASSSGRRRMSMRSVYSATSSAPGKRLLEAGQCRDAFGAQRSVYITPRGERAVVPVRADHRIGRSSGRNKRAAAIHGDQNRGRNPTRRTVAAGVVDKYSD